LFATDFFVCFHEPGDEGMRLKKNKLKKI